MQQTNPVEILEKSGVDKYHILWSKRAVQVDNKKDLLKIMAQFDEPHFTAFSIDGWLFTTERLVEKFGGLP